MAWEVILGFPLDKVISICKIGRMKIFDNEKDWGGKVNFVDENNVVLGYDMYQSCCENFGWFISDKIESEILQQMDSGDAGDLSSFVFDTSFYEEFDIEYDGGIVVFRIFNETSEKFIHLFNVHNGYYGHGFDFKVGEQTLQEGWI